METYLGLKNTVKCADGNTRLNVTFGLINGEPAYQDENGALLTGATKVVETIAAEYIGSPSFVGMHILQYRINEGIV